VAKVTAAAASPIASWRSPDRHGDRLVTRVMAAPIVTRPTALAARLTGTAALTGRNANHATGIAAPATNRAEEDVAAVHAEPPSPSGSMPSSSRAITASARSGSAITWVAIWSATEADRPRAR
jgi:hypothetical protein